MSELSISLTIADRPYKLVVEKEQERDFQEFGKAY